jgi:hypothetical protein
MTSPMAPSVTGLDSGWVVAWGTTSGIELCAFRDTLHPSVSTFRSNIVTVSAGGMSFGCMQIPPTLQTIALYPSLAWYPQRATINGTLSQAVHLAWQQDTGNAQIFYNLLGARFVPGVLPTLTTTTNEHVSDGLLACSFRHPSIAADSVRIGVAFEMNKPFDTLVVLRFQGAPARRPLCFGNSKWTGVTYAWAPTTSLSRRAQRPSLTEFPRILRLPNQFTPQGALAWFEITTTGKQYQQFYRYGWGKKRPLASGQHPSMMLVPYRDQPSNALASSAVFYRAADSASFALPRAVGKGTNVYFPAMVINTPAMIDAAFQGPTEKNSITGGVTVSRGYADCASWTRSVTIKIKHGNDVIGPSGFPLPPGGTRPSLPPVFFIAPIDSVTAVRSLVDASTIMRTSDFLASIQQVTVQRIVQGSDSLVTWLDSQPYDSSLSSSADIKVVAELVRAGDSTVLWRSDTVSARGVGAGTRDEVVEVPVSTAAAPGTPVFVQLRTFTTQGVQFDLNGGFTFETDSTGIWQKVVRSIHGSAALGDRDAAVSMAVLPNPTRGTAEILVRVKEPGMLRATLYDVLGRVVRVIPASDCASAGEYSLPLDMTDLPNGTYMVRAVVVDHTTMQKHDATTRFTVMH